MIEKSRLEKIQELLADQEVDGWLLFDNHGSNPFIRQILKIPRHQVLTRRFFYLITKRGVPKKILHVIEANNLKHLAGETLTYLSRIELEKALRETLAGIKSLMMEYSPCCANPFVSVVDGGTIEMIRNLGVTIVSSGDVLQNLTSCLTQEQIATHLEAAGVVQQVVKNAWDFIAARLKKRERITEYDVQEFVRGEFTARGCLAEVVPCSCSVNAHTAMPHYLATEQEAAEIAPNDFILIDLWCKRDLPDAVYADITRVAVAASAPTIKQNEVFQIVLEAQKKAFAFVKQKIESGRTVKGFEVDDICRDHIKASGYGSFFTHRTGHNIDINVHGAGAHFDNLETSDSRQLLPAMCFSVEPGIYLPGEFGIRLESNLLIRENHTVEVTGGVEENLICLLP